MTALGSTAFRTAEEAIDFVGDFLELSSENSVIGIDLDGNIVRWSEGARRTYGYEAAEVIGKALTMLHAGSVRAARASGEMLQGALNEGKWEGIVQRLRKDGTAFTARGAAIRRCDADGSPSGFLEFTSHVSDSGLRTREPEKTQLHARPLIESATDALVAIDRDGAISDVNERTCRVSGAGREELVGRPFRDFFTEPERAAECFQRTLAEGQATGCELTVRADNGHETILSCNLSLLTDAPGTVQSVLVVARDITELKRFEEDLQRTNLQLAKANQSKDRFLAGMSHELRTPLNAILGFTGTLLMELPGGLNDEQKKQLRTVQSNGRHLLTIINDLLDLARIQSESVELAMAELHCGEVLEEVSQGLRPLAEEKGIVLRVQLDNPDAMVRSDRRSLSQILINLTGNAIKFTAEGVVTISFEQRPANAAGSLARFKVMDTGVGIKSNEQDKLFAAFEQAASSATPSHEGTGLGLYLSQRLAALIDGRISFESEYGKGSTFILDLMES